ncbi:hypothetical protein ACO02O_02909 [Dirofilaria immitis]
MHLMNKSQFRSRINQNISGQIFMLSTSNDVDRVDVIYENQLQLIIS